MFKNFFYTFNIIPFSKNKKAIDFQIYLETLREPGPIFFISFKKNFYILFNIFGLLGFYFIFSKKIDHAGFGFYTNFFL